MEPDLKMYILIKDTTPSDIVPLIVAHTAMGTYRRFRDRPLMKAWFESVLFKKVICKVTPEQFEQARRYGEHFALVEVHRPELDGIGLGFDIQVEYPKFLKFLPLYRV